MKLPLDLIPLPPQDSQARGRAYPRRSKSLLNDWCGMMPSGGDDQPIPNRGCLLHLGHSNMDPQSPSPPPDRALVEIKPIVHPSEINWPQRKVFLAKPGSSTFRRRRRSIGVV